MDLKKIIVCILTILFPLLSHSVDTINHKGIIQVDNNKTIPDVNNKPANLNTPATFAKIKKNDFKVLLIGNNDYKQSSHYPPLFQCINDTRLMAGIFRNCCKISPENISVCNDITKKDFIQLFNMTVHNLKAKDGLILYYSGHGARDGSLVFTDGERLTPAEFKMLINSFHNDTIIFIDACYSGNQEGPIEIEGEEKIRSNCIRVYSSLAHMTAKEILYKKDYFTYIQPFFNNVLGFNDDAHIEGNGYFTSLIAYFFAEYDFNNSGNIDFWDLVYYISNKNKQHVEYLAVKSKHDKGLVKEYQMRSYQQPKIYPLTDHVTMNNPNHEFLVIKKYIKPVDLSTEIGAGVFLNFGTLKADGESSVFKNKPSLFASFKVYYGPQILRGFHFGIDIGYMYAYEEKNTQLHRRSILLNIIPIMGTLGFHHKFAGLKNKLSLRIDGSSGVSLNIWKLGDYDIEPERYYSASRFCFSGSVGIGLHPVDTLTIALGVTTFGLVYDIHAMLLGIAFPVSISFSF